MDQSTIEESAAKLDTQLRGTFWYQCIGINKKNGTLHVYTHDTPCGPFSKILKFENWPVMYHKTGGLRPIY